ncbi:MAG: hypothetical protein HY362_01880 [Candidatus Aenigmarchaeota archaeon]|nr:hypothetical protein [Candidatus Aenigmarchaeota archaeon]
MPIVGLTMKEVRGKRIGDVVGEINVNNNTTLKDIKAISLPGINKEGLQLEFDFTSDYVDKGKKSLGNFFVNGQILFVDGDGERAVELWKKSKLLPEDIHLSIMNAVLRKSLIKVVELADYLQLPPPVSMPVAIMEDKKGK